MLCDRCGSIDVVRARARVMDKVVPHRASEPPEQLPVNPRSTTTNITKAVAAIVAMIWRRCERFRRLREVRRRTFGGLTAVRGSDEGAELGLVLGSRSSEASDGSGSAPPAP